MKLLLLCLLVFGVNVASHAHPNPQPDCTPPQRPADDQNDAQWQAFLRAIDDFRGCTERHMHAHQQAVVDHQQAAKAAVEMWNDFVRTSLNAPEDFPWPPEERNSARE